MEKLLDTIITSHSFIEAHNMKFLCVLQENPQSILYAEAPTHFVLCGFSSKESVIIALSKKMLMCYFLCSFSVLYASSKILSQPTNFIISFKEETAILSFVFFLKTLLWHTKILYLLSALFIQIVCFHVKYSVW